MTSIKWGAEDDRYLAKVRPWRSGQLPPSAGFGRQRCDRCQKLFRKKRRGQRFCPHRADGDREAARVGMLAGADLAVGGTGRLGVIQNDGWNDVWNDVAAAGAGRQHRATPDHPVAACSDRTA